MVLRKRLGIHWGEKGFVFVEAANEAPAQTAFVPFSAGLETALRDTDFLDILQRTIRNKRIATVETYLSLPSKDIFIRWFLIPWVKTSEIQDLVSFEIKKYIPFNISEISYTYYPKTVVKDGLRQIGILFVGTRKDSLEKYVNVLTQAGLNVVYSEPSAMSLVRALVSRRLLDLSQVTAILQTSDDAGELIITTGGQVKFIRDFKVDLGREAGASQEHLRAKMFGEVRISLEFFARQYAQEDVSRILIISPEIKQSLWSGLSDDLGVTVNVVDPLRAIGGGEGMDMGGINAFGATLAGTVAAVVDFNLSENSSRPVALKKDEVARRNRQLLMPVLVGVACAAMVGAAFFVGGIFVDGMRQKLSNATVQVSGYEKDALEDLQGRIDTERNKMDAVRSLPLKARAVPLILRLIKIVARDGVWLNGIQAGFADTRPASNDSGKSVVYEKVSTRKSLVLTGYVYRNDSNKEFDLVNEIVNDLRKDEMFAAAFRSIKLTSLRSEQVLGGTMVKAFSIACEEK